MWGVRLLSAETELDGVMKNLREKQGKLADVEKKIATLQQEYDDSVSQKRKLEQNMSLTSARLKRAAKLTTALADEKVRWEESVEVRGGGRGEGGEGREGRRAEHVSDVSPPQTGSEADDGAG